MMRAVLPHPWTTTGRVARAWMQFLTRLGVAVCGDRRTATVCLSKSNMNVDLCPTQVAKSRTHCTRAALKERPLGAQQHREVFRTARGVYETTAAVPEVARIPNPAFADHFGPDPPRGGF